MAEFREHWAARALDSLLANEAGPSGHIACAGCEAKHSEESRTYEEGATARDVPAITTGSYRCADCYLAPLLCKQCVRDTHVHNPFHQIHEWSSSQGFWRRRGLGELGLVICLGHAGGRCPLSIGDARRMTMVHEHGIAALDVRFCACSARDSQGTVPEALQLIEFGLFPASWQTPRSAFTVRVLKDFHLLSLQAQLSAHDFYNYLRRTTDNVGADDIEVRGYPIQLPYWMTYCVQDRYRELLTAMREFTFLRQVKRAGVLPTGKLPSGSLAVLCPACPQPGMNMDPAWRQRPEKLRYANKRGVVMALRA